MSTDHHQTRRAFLAKSAAVAAAAGGLGGATARVVLAAAGNPAPEWDLSGWLNGDGGEPDVGHGEPACRIQQAGPDIRSGPRAQGMLAMI